MTFSEFNMLTTIIKVSIETDEMDIDQAIEKAKLVCFPNSNKEK